MNWQKTQMNDGTDCYFNEEFSEVIVLEIPSAIKHHFDPYVVLEIWEGNIWQESVQKPNSYSIVGIARYLDKYAEIGYNELGEIFDEWYIPDGFRGYQIFHAWCTEPGYYDYCEYTPYQENGTRHKWRQDLNDYRRQGGRYYAF